MLKAAIFPKRMYHQGTKKTIIKRPLTQKHLPVDGLHPLLDAIF